MVQEKEDDQTTVVIGNKAETVRYCFWPVFPPSNNKNIKLENKYGLCQGLALEIRSISYFLDRNEVSFNCDGQDGQEKGIKKKKEGDPVAKWALFMMVASSLLLLLPVAPISKEKNRRSCNFIFLWPSKKVVTASHGETIACLPCRPHKLIPKWLHCSRILTLLLHRWPTNTFYDFSTLTKGKSHLLPGPFFFFFTPPDTFFGAWEKIDPLLTVLLFFTKGLQPVDTFIVASFNQKERINYLRLILFKPRIFFFFQYFYYVRAQASGKWQVIWLGTRRADTFQLFIRPIMERCERVPEERMILYIRHGSFI